MTKPLQSSQFHLVFHWYFTYFCHNILISSLVPQGHSYNVSQAIHLEGMQSFEVLLSDCPCLRSIQKYRHHHHSEHMSLGLLTHTSTSKHLPPPHLVHCGCLPQSCAHLSIYSSSLPHFTPQIKEFFHSLQCVAPKCDCWLVTHTHTHTNTHTHMYTHLPQLVNILGGCGMASPFSQPLWIEP